LHGAALVLALDLERMDRLAGVFDHGIALDVDAPGFLVDLDIDDVQAEAGAGPSDVHLGMAGDGAVGRRRLRRDLRDRHRFESADVGAGGPAVAVPERLPLFRHGPNPRSALAQFGDRLAGGIDDYHAGRIGGAAAGGDAVEAERVGVGHDGAHLVDGDAQLLG